MSLPPMTNGYPFDIYNYSSCSHINAAATAQTSQTNSSLQSSMAKSDRENHSHSNSRERERSRERHDSTSRDRDHKSMFGSQIDHDKPPFSRVFVVCSKSHSSENLRSAFEEFGTVEDVWVVKDKQTKENRGVAYIKFSKMSEACLAIEKMDGKKLSEGDDSKPLKVCMLFDISCSLLK